MIVLLVLAVLLPAFLMGVLFGFRQPQRHTVMGPVLVMAGFSAASAALFFSSGSLMKAAGLAAGVILVNMGILVGKLVHTIRPAHGNGGAPAGGAGTEQ